MEGDTLYSVKWYRNEREFFRYVPNDRPKLQIFPQHGIRVEVIKIKVFDPLKPLEDFGLEFGRPPISE